MMNFQLRTLMAVSNVLLGTIAPIWLTLSSLLVNWEITRVLVPLNAQHVRQGTIATVEQQARQR